MNDEIKEYLIFGTAITLLVLVLIGAIYTLSYISTSTNNECKLNMIKAGTSVTDAIVLCKGL